MLNLIQIIMKTLSTYIHIVFQRGLILLLYNIIYTFEIYTQNKFNNIQFSMGIYPSFITNYNH